MFTIHEVISRADLLRFIKFPDKLYATCAQYVPALHRSEEYALTKSATLSYCKHKMWLVLDGTQVVGRICAIINPRYNELYGKKRVRFGWFDCIKDIEVARMLIGAAEKWAAEQGMTEIHGPLSLNSLGKQGMLVEGYENTPPFNCLYNYPYYNDLVQDLGFEKECDWLQYKVVANHGVPEKTRRLAKVVQEKYNLHSGSIDELKKDPEMVRKFFRVYNESLQSVYDFVPLTDAEIDEASGKFNRYVSDKASCLLFDEHDEIAAFGISFPSLSEALKKAKGSRFPLGWWYLRRALRNYADTDLMVNGAAPEWQNKGISSLYYKEMADKAIKIGNRWAISNPQIESDSAVNIWNSYEHEPFMRRRCYIKKIGE